MRHLVLSIGNYIESDFSCLIAGLHTAQIADYAKTN